ncbi:MAG: flagellar hook-length control FliK family protein [Rhizobium sp.]|nr:flagellar hook-length control FliK family protein [Rhizobium sp.]
MIDQSTIGLPAVHPSHSGGKRDKSGASLDQGKTAKSFGDLVEQAVKKNSRKTEADLPAVDMPEAVEQTQGADKTSAVDKTSMLDEVAIDAGNFTDDSEDLLFGDRHEGDVETGKDSEVSNDHRAENQRKTGNEIKAGTELETGNESEAGNPPRTRTEARIGYEPGIASGSKAASEPKAVSEPNAVSEIEVAIEPKIAIEPKAGNEPKTGKVPSSLNDLMIGTSLRDEQNIETATTNDAIENDAAPQTGIDAEVPPTEGRVRLSAGFQHLMRTSAEGGVLRSVDSRVSPARGEKPETGKDHVAGKDTLPAVAETKAKTPAEELRALLGLAPEEAEETEEPVEHAADKSTAKTPGGNDDQLIDSKPAKQEQAIDATTQAVGKDAAEALQSTVVQHAAFNAVPHKAVSAETDFDDKRNQPEINVEKIRVTSSDGRARPVDIELAKSKTDDSTEPSAGGKTDFVTVLESRRYLGFTNDSNAGALTNAIKSDASWAQVIQSVNNGSHHTATEVNTLKLQMNPDHLGTITAQLRLKGEELSVEVRVETVEAYRQLSNDQDGILKALRDQGFTIDQVSVQLSPSARSDSSQNGTSQNNGNQQGTGQSPQEGQGDNARQRDDGARRNSGNQNNWMGNDRTSSFSDSGGGADDTGTGNLYL